MPVGLAALDERAAAEERTVKIGLHHRIELFRSGFGDGLAARSDARAVDENIERAKRLLRLLEHVGDRALVAHVKLPLPRPSARLLHLPAGLVRARLVGMEGDGHVGTLARELLGDRLTDSGI